MSANIKEQNSATAAREALAETLTPEQAGALLEIIRPAIDAMAEGFRAVAQSINALLPTACDLVSKRVNAELYFANEHPKWWHYYKHSKKLRTRRKYRKLLMRQLLRKMAAGSL